MPPVEAILFIIIEKIMPLWWGTPCESFGEQAEDV